MSDADTDRHDSYWGQVRNLGFALPCCAACGRFHFYPRPACPFCGSADVAPARTSGRGTVYSYSIVHRAPSPAFAADVPYTVAIVATGEGPHLMTRLVGIAPDQVRIGLRVQVHLGAPGQPPQFEPATTEAS
ncbi:Zn-ribbon domain-containing OB-fold protein [Bordetella sp. BOR01]|uniref:Zn-ribbon domain-containing OB-fold protein n=1 Tax=Bordetella sp. BOR01 TaxID=2854779 RepID=UPI001C44E8F1|nr:Zn-ribbon domain-containing OB-fold protein [Bordetella sp. BOR01]MBV7482167.1 Zn-ribbon domain-containing OB-fold protein [Bordetella sp. BOR01]